MALFDSEGFDELVAELKKESERLTSKAPDMLKAGADVLADAWREAIRRHELIDTGDMLDSVSVSDLVVSSSEKKITVSPAGKDRKGIRNGEKAFVNHYGASHRQATHFVDDAEQSASEPLVDAMRTIWNSD